MQKVNNNMRDLGFIEGWAASSVEARLVSKVTDMGFRFVCLSLCSDGSYVYECKEANLMFHSKSSI